MGDEEKSKAAYREADILAEASGEDLCRLMGDRLLRKGMNRALCGYLPSEKKFWSQGIA